MFVAVYWWRVKPGKERQFRDAWCRGTRAIARIYGGLGSRLHRERDGRFVAIAEWPDYGTWKRAFDAKMAYDDPQTRAQFVDAVAEVPPGNAPAFTMEVTDDLLARTAHRRPDADASLHTKALEVDHMKLYFTPGACSLAPHIAMRELGLPFDTVPVDLAKHTLPDGSDFRAINPKGYVPLLELDDGTRITEASVILQYVADRRPGTLAAPFGTPERWQLMEWLAFIATEVHKGFGPLWNPATPAEARERTVQALGSRFSLLAGTLGTQPFLTGQSFSIADAYLFVVLNWCGLHHVDLSPWPALTAFQARVAARPAVQAALKAEGLIR
jgi:glutathione S-transferase